MTRRSIHLTAVDDEFLHSVFMAGLVDPAGKFEASHSAVVRLALEILARQMSPESIVAELRRRAPNRI